MTSARMNPFLSGNWAPLETTTDQDGVPGITVSGIIPQDLHGSFLRVGPNPGPKLTRKLQHNENLRNSFHFFSGDGLIVGVEFHNGLATCRTRFIETDQYKTGEMFQTLPNGEQEMTGSGNTALVFHNKRLLALSEGSKPWEIELPRLNTVGRHLFNNELAHNFTAHPKVCPITNELIFFGYQFGTDTIRYSVADEQGKILTTTNAINVPFRQPVAAPTPHDIAITRNYSIMLDFPLWSMAGGPTKKEDQSLFGVLPRLATQESQVKWYSTEGQFGYHVANAFEEGAEGAQECKLRLIMCTGLDFDFRTSNKRSMLLREWVLDCSAGGTQACPTALPAGHVLCSVPCEFPVVDERRTGLSFQYVWASRLHQGRHAAPLACNGLLRHDITTGETTMLTFPNEMQGGECQFVSKRGGKGKGGKRGREGDGYLVLLAHDTELRSYVLIYDAMFQGEDAVPIATVDMACRAPNGFHALWVDGECYDDTRINDGGGGSSGMHSESRARM